MTKKSQPLDQDQLKTWLDHQDHQTCVWLGCRAALRLVPDLWDEHYGQASGNSSLQTMRCLIISAAAATDQTIALGEYVERALAACRASELAQRSDEGASLILQDSAASTAHALARIEYSISDVSVVGVTNVQPYAKEFLHAVAKDLDLPRNWKPLWLDSEPPAKFLMDWHTVKDCWSKDLDDWSFWVEWYEAIVNGNPLPWDLTQRIALEISEEEWDAGQETVAKRIEEIRWDYRTSVAPRLVPLENGRWDIEEDVEVADEPVAFAIAQVEIALAAALGADRGNGLSETSNETLLIRKAAFEFRSLPSAVATSYWNACMGLQRNIGNLYPEDAALIALQNALYTSVEELCAQNPLIQERVARLAVLETRRMPTSDERAELATVPQAVADELTPPALEQLTEAIEIIVETDKPARIWRAKLVNWLTTLGRGLDKAQANEKRAIWLLKLARKIAGWFFEHD